MAQPLKVLMVAGEASGDQLGAHLAEALAQMEPGAQVCGIGGDRMAAAGVELIYHCRHLGIVGFAELLPKLNHLWSAYRAVKKRLRQERPPVVVLIDFPDFNFMVGKFAHKLGCRVLYYVCPQVWAWRVGRARAMGRFVDRLAAILPFEPEFLAPLAPDLAVEYVGHPLLETGPAPAASPLPVPENRVLVGLLPGSRDSEINHLLPTLLRAASLMRQQREDLHFLLPVAPGLDRAKLEPHLAQAPRGLTILSGASRRVMAASRLLLVASGTATLEAALAGTPMVVVYKTGGFNYFMARRLVKVENIAMPNLIAGRQVVPELIQDKATPQELARQGLELLEEGPARQEMLEGLAEVRRRLGGPGANQRVAAMVLELAGGNG